MQKRIETFRRDGWAKPWPVGMEMLCYMTSHEAHHRGQVYMLAHQLGFPLPNKVMSAIWDWEKLWKECGQVTHASQPGAHPLQVLSQKERKRKSSSESLL